MDAPQPLTRIDVDFILHSFVRSSGKLCQVALSCSRSREELRDNERDNEREDLSTQQHQAQVDEALSHLSRSTLRTVQCPLYWHLQSCHEPNLFDSQYLIVSHSHSLSSLTAQLHAPKLLAVPGASTRQRPVTISEGLRVGVMQRPQGAVGPKIDGLPKVMISCFTNTHPVGDPFPCGTSSIKRSGAQGLSWH